MYRCEGKDWTSKSRLIYIHIMLWLIISNINIHSITLVTEGKQNNEWIGERIRILKAIGKEMKSTKWWGVLSSLFSIFNLFVLMVNDEIVQWSWPFHIFIKVYACSLNHMISYTIFLDCMSLIRYDLCMICLCLGMLLCLPLCSCYSRMWWEPDTITKMQNRNGKPSYGLGYNHNEAMKIFTRTD